YLTRDAMQPASPLFDVVGLLCLASLLHRRLPQTANSNPPYCLIFLLILVWANLSFGAVWGILWLICTSPKFSNVRHEPDQQVFADEPSLGQSLRWKWRAICLVLLAVSAASLTFRGPLLFRDWLLTLAPNVVSGTSTLCGRESATLFQSVPWTASEFVFVLAAVTSCVSAAKTRAIGAGTGDSWFVADGRAGPLLMTLVPILAGLLNRENIPVSGVWMLLTATTGDRRAGIPAESFRLVHRNGTRAVLALLVLCLCVADASGRFLPDYRRLSWGISAELDHRLLDVDSLSPILERLPSPREFEEANPIAWATDIRSAGVIAWLFPQMKLVDTPRQALLNGRLSVHEALIHDLHGAHRARYRRQDGSWGGWVNQLASWKVDLMIVPIEQAELLRDLQLSTWRSIDLDSPIVPYVSTDDTAFDRIILENLLQEDFVEAGPWAPGIDVYDGMGWRTDFVQMVTGKVDPMPAVRQSRRFRTMRLNMAALRALLPVRQEQQHPLLWDEFYLCQKAIAESEALEFGRSSFFRELVVQTMSGLTKNHGSGFAEPRNDAAAVRPESTETLYRSQWADCVSHYVRGNLPDAISALTEGTPEQRFATAMIWLELGKPDRTTELLASLLNESLETPLRTAAIHWHDQTKTFSSQQQ
ncbi:MAG: hypothetical protein KDA81_12275, partial [Planctomycetaceae bacterium]|nr:hypothetical protein [Planctomycetaceae bacterium]